jgi:hypothetical protein
LLVAIAVVGGAIVFAYSQNFFSSSQVGGRPTIEAVKILGYDGRDVSQLQDHNGVLLADGSGGTSDSQKLAGEKVLVYIKNDNVQPITESELRFGASEVRIGKLPSKGRIIVSKSCPITGKLLMSDSAVKGTLHENIDSECALFTNSEEMTNNIFTLCNFIWKSGTPLDL